MLKFDDYTIEEIYNLLVDLIPVSLNIRISTKQQHKAVHEIGKIIKYLDIEVEKFNIIIQKLIDDHSLVLCAYGYYLGLTFGLLNQECFNRLHELYIELGNVKQMEAGVLRSNFSFPIFHNFIEKGFNTFISNQQHIGYYDKEFLLKTLRFRYKNYRNEKNEMVSMLENINTEEELNQMVKGTG